MIIYHLAQETKPLVVHLINPDFEYQWYLSGVALEGETSSDLSQNYGEGSYQVRISDGTTCRISETYEYSIPIYNTPVRVAICQGDFYEFGELQLTTPGFYIDTFQTQNNCDSIVPLELEVIGARYDTVKASIFEGDAFEIGDYKFHQAGEYPLTFTSSLGCDSLVLLKLSNFNVYIPNVFSPNDDGINDVFRPFAPLGEIDAIDMKIFDRWGNLLYQGPEWDGFALQPGVFVYLINIDFVYGASKIFYGAVTLVK